MKKKASQEPNGTPAAVEAAGDQQQAAVSDGNLDTNRMDALDRARQKRRENAAAGIVPVRPSYLIIGGRDDGSQVVLSVHPSQGQCRRWLAMASAMLRDNYQTVTVIRGKPVTDQFTE